MSEETPKTPALRLVKNTPCPLIMILAVSWDGAIGKDGTMPWYFREDLERFKSTTMGHVVVMGRVTFESIVKRIHKPLPGRVNVVLTRSACGRSDFLAKYPGHLIDGYDVRFVNTADEVLAIAEMEQTQQRKTYVAGGAMVYNLLLPYVREINATIVHQVYPEADTFLDFETIRDRFVLWKSEDPQNPETPIKFEYLVRREIFRRLAHLYK